MSQHSLKLHSTADTTPAQACGSIVSSNVTPRFRRGRCTQMGPLIYARFGSAAPETVNGNVSTGVLLYTAVAHHQAVGSVEAHFRSCKMARMYVRPRI